MDIDVKELSRIYDRYFFVIRADTPALLDRAYQIRYQVYCIENSFEDPGQNFGGREVDAEDDRAAHVLLIHRNSGEAAGTARVIFPDAADRRPLPIEPILDPDGRRLFRRLPAPTTGEVSRFAVSKAFRRRHGEERYPDVGSAQDAEQSLSAERRAMPFITFGLLRGIVGICLDQGISHIAAVMEPPLIRLLLRFGLDFHALGGPVEYHGLRQPCVARLGDLIKRARGEGSVLWHYAGADISHRGRSAGVPPSSVGHPASGDAAALHPSLIGAP